MVLRKVLSIVISFILSPRRSTGSTSPALRPSHLHRHTFYLKAEKKKAKEAAAASA